MYMASPQISLVLFCQIIGVFKKQKCKLCVCSVNSIGYVVKIRTS